MLRAIRNFFVIIGHPLGANVNEWVEVLAAGAERTSDGHVTLGYLGQLLVGDEEGEQSYVDIRPVVRQ
jgi:hypothetical protein